MAAVKGRMSAFAPIGVYVLVMSNRDGDEAPDEEWGNDRARASPWLSLVFWLAIVAGLAWIGLNGYVQIRQQLDGDQLFSSPEAADFFWAQAVAGISYTVFLVSVGTYVLVWLRSRPPALPGAVEERG